MTDYCWSEHLQQQFRKVTFFLFTWRWTCSVFKKFYFQWLHAPLLYKRTPKTQWKFAVFTWKCLRDVWPTGRLACGMFGLQVTDCFHTSSLRSVSSDHFQSCCFNTLWFSPKTKTSTSSTYIRPMCKHTETREGYAYKDKIQLRSLH